MYFLVAPVHNTAILYYAGVFGVVQAMFVSQHLYGVRCLPQERCAGGVGRQHSFLRSHSAAPCRWGGYPIPESSALALTWGVLRRRSSSWRSSAFLLATYQQANRSRELLVASLVERDGAVRVASHREALLVEARNELEQALHAGGFGRFSDQTLGSFKLGAIVGRGGMGEVYEAVHVETGEPAAVKMLLPSVLGRPEFVRRFLREVGIASSLDSPHVVKVLEIGDESAAMPYLAMERLFGKTLADLLRERGRLETRAVSKLLRQVADGLQAAAAAGIVHRDLKPQNLFLTRDEPRTWKILDFGISKLAGGTDTLTQGQALGTPQYMAPEQARGEAVDLRTDLYALGAIAYRALTGYRPFGGDESAAVLVKVLSSAPKRPSSCVDLPADMDRFLAIAMAKDPADRFQTTSELVGAFAASAAERLDPRDRVRADRLVNALPWDPYCVTPPRWRSRRGIRPTPSEANAALAQADTRAFKVDQTAMSTRPTTDSAAAPTRTCPTARCSA